MGSKEKLALAVLVAIVAFYFFGLNALYLCGVVALIYLVVRPRRR